MYHLAAEVNINTPGSTWGWVGVAALALLMVFIAARGAVSSLEIASVFLRKGLLGVTAIAALLALSAYKEDPSTASTDLRLSVFSDATTTSTPAVTGQGLVDGLTHTHDGTTHFHPTATD